MNPTAPSVSSVADRRSHDADPTTERDASGRQVSASEVEAALADALSRAAVAGRFDVVAQLASELEARRLARASNVVRPGD